MIDKDYENGNFATTHLVMDYVSSIYLYISGLWYVYMFVFCLSILYGFILFTVIVRTLYSRDTQ